MQRTRQWKAFYKTTEALEKPPNLPAVGDSPDLLKAHASGLAPGRRPMRQREPWRLPARRGEGERPRAGLDVLGKVAPRDRVAVGERARALDNVLQLTYVAAPGS